MLAERFKLAEEGFFEAVLRAFFSSCKGANHAFAHWIKADFSAEWSEVKSLAQGLLSLAVKGRKLGD